ncbi:YdcF family protein [Paenibacillus rigui]|uniref:DUF218 domain-containing protein n=1 Tax=Paenibacillus rigui TaxID=554312 RepID=A0A229UXT3_9BACL|nr:YdcF family protein [Paenibacillus rigui]OXM87925.1 hypothetical protein CF651_02125 [Paenibacillus rigui]
MITTRYRNPGRSAVRKIISRVMTVLLLIWGGVFQWKMAVFPDNPYSRADVGIVLGAALWGDTPSPALQERLVRAVELYNDRRISHLIVAGGNAVGSSRLSEAEGMRKELIRLGIPAEVITMENKSATTFENLSFSGRLMQDNGWRTALIITHRYHAVRALDMARYLEYDQVTVSPIDSKVLFMPWHKARETLAMMKWQLQKLMLRLQ